MGRPAAVAILGVLAYIGATAGLAHAQDAQPAGVLWRANRGYKLAPSALAVDVYLDGTLEIVLVGQDKRVALIDAANGGKLIWETQLEQIEGEFGEGSVVAGHFLGDHTIDIAVVSSGGTLTLLDGVTGAPVSSFNLDFPPATPPVVVPVTRPNRPSDQFREGILIVGENRELRTYILRPGDAPETFYRADLTGGLIGSPPAVGRTGFSGPPPHLVLATDGGRIDIISGVPGAEPRMTFSLPDSVRLRTWLAIGNLTGDDADEIVIVDDEGFVYAYQIQDDAAIPLWDKGTVLRAPASPPALIDVDGDGWEDLVVPSQGGRELYLIGGATGMTPQAWPGNEYRHPKRISSPLAVFRGADGRAYAAFGTEDIGGFVSVVDLKDARQVLEYEIESSASRTPLVGAFSQPDSAAVFALSARSGDGVLIGLGQPLAATSLPWLGDRGGSRRTASLSAEYRKFLEAQRDTFGGWVLERVAEADRALQNQEWEQAMIAAGEALAANPFNHEARTIHRRAFIRANLIALIAGLLAALLAAGLIVWRGTVLATRLIRLRSVDRALEREDAAGAAGVLLKVHRALPRNLEHLERLAKLMIELKDNSKDAAQIFAHAREAFPEDDRYVRSLAGAYSHLRRHDAEAARAYEDMVRVSSKPGPWAFVLGQAYVEMGDDAQALDAFHRAVRHGFKNASLPNYLADLYVKLQITQPEVLPTMQRVLDERENDREFLTVLCRASQQARNYDESAHRAAEWLLKLDAGSAEAHVILSSRLLRSGQIKASMSHAESILEGSPNDTIGLRLLGACYAAENRLDDTAMQIFARALEANPEANEILVAVSHGFIQAGRDDDEARLIYQRAIEGSPNEETILEQLARIAGKQTDDGLTIRTVEKLLEVGRHSRELILQLAEAYCRGGVTEDRAEEVYREALIFQPDHATVAGLLARIYVRHKRRDAEAIAVYESVTQKDSGRDGVARELAFSYAEADLAEKTLDLARELIQKDPNDVEMKKLAAHASESLDQMDTAMAAYEHLLERHPEDDETLCRLASIYGRKRLTSDKAIETLERGVRIQKDNLDLHAALARAYAARTDWNRVVATVKHFLSHASERIGPGVHLMEELVEAAPTALKLRWFLVETLIYDGQLRDATNHLIEIVRLDPSQNHQALASFDRILTKNPQDARAHQHRGRILFGLGREPEARHSLEQALRHNPTDEAIVRDLMALYQKMLETRDLMDVRFQLGKLALQTGKPDLAISCFQKTDKDYRWESESVRYLARCFMAKGMLDLGLQELRRIPVEDEAKDILYELGQRYEAVNDVPGAREVYKMIFAVDIGFKDVKGKIEALAGGVNDPMAAERTAIMSTLSEEAKARYDLIQEIGRGAMGIVYRARDNELEEMVALKILPDALGKNPDALRRFRQEARNARRLSHPNIVRIHDIGEELGRKYISMEFVNGTDLKQRLKECKRKLPLTELLHYAKQICEALEAAHDAGIVHRDIKPANIMINKNGKVKVTDFGIAKMLLDESHADVTKVGAVVGTPLYMSPEQVKGKGVDHRADLYSLGVMLYELLTGQPCFVEGDLAYHHVFTKPKPISKDLPEDLARIIMKCLEKDPAERFQDAREIFNALNQVVLPEEPEPSDLA